MNCMNLRSQKLHETRSIQDAFKWKPLSACEKTAAQWRSSQWLLHLSCIPPLSPHCPVSDDFILFSYTGFNIRNKQASKTLKMISAVLCALAQYKACGLSHCEHTCNPHHLWPSRAENGDAIKEVLLGKRKTPRMPLPNKHLRTQCSLHLHNTS